MNKDKKHAQVFHYDLYGKRQEKYNFLLENNLQSIEWMELQPAEPDYFFVPKDFSLKEEYENGLKINELFVVYGSGIETGYEDLINLKISTKHNTKYAFRPFDARFINYDLEKLRRNSFRVMCNFLYKDNIGLLVSRQSITEQFGFFVSDKICDRNYTGVAAQYGAGLLFPLYLYQEHFGQTEKIVNMNGKIRDQISTTATPEQIFDYTYAVLHSPSYREKYKEFLKIDFPRIPYPKDADHFNKFVAFGEKLRHLHLMENITVPNNFANFPKSGNNRVENSFTPKSNGYHDRKAWINDAQYFDNVPETAWNFYIGGYQPAQKWLKDRKGRALSYEEIAHYQKIIFALSETDEIMKKIGRISI